MKRWSLLLVAAVVLALLALLVWKRPSRDGVDSAARAPIEAPIQPSAMSDSNTDTNVEGPKVDASSVSVDSVHTRAVVSVEGATLRIHVKLDGLTRRPRNFHLSLIDSYACDVALEDNSEFEFSASALAAGTYMLELTSDGIQNTHQIVEVKTSPREQDVDLSARRKQRLRVRWSGIHRSIQDELAAMPIREDRRVTLSVRATMQRPRPDSSIDSTTIASLSRTFDLHPRTNDTNMVDEAPQLSSRFPPNDPDAPPDTFGYLLLAEPLPLYVSVWIDGRLLDSDPIAPNAIACSFATSFAGLGDLRTSLRLCVVDEESGAPLPTASVGEVGVADAWKLDDAGCLLESKLRSGPHSLWIRHPDRAPFYLRVTTLPGVPIDLGEVRLSKPKLVDVRLVDAAGAPIRGAIVVAYSFDGNHEAVPLGAQWTGVDGSARISGLAHGRYTLSAGTADVLSEPCLVDARATGARFELVARRSITIGIHVQPAPPPASTVRIVYKTNGAPVWNAGLSLGGWSCVRLVPGDYTAELIEDDIPTRSGEFTVGDTSFIFEFAR